MSVTATVTNMNFTSTPTLESYRSSQATNVGTLFSKYIDLAVEEEDIFATMEGTEGSDRPIWVKTDLTKTGADKVSFNSVAYLGGDGVLGDETLQGSEEALQIGSYVCQVDFVRHAVALTQKAINFLAAGQTLEAAAAPLVAKWLGRKRQRDMMTSFIRSAASLNTIRPNNRANRDAITATDTLSTTLISQAAAVATTIGAKPINIMKDGYSKIYEFLFLATEDALVPLSTSSNWLQAQQYAGTRGDENILFRGGFTRWNGNTIVRHKVVDGDTAGPIGSPLLPKALLGTAVAAGTTAFDITGGGVSSPSTTTKFFQSFSGAPYRYVEGDSTTSTDSATYYAVIVNVSGTDAGKWGFYGYTGSSNTGNKITVASRLGSAAGGIRVATLGGVTWNSAKNTDVHPTGSVVLQANANGVPIGFSLCLGQGAALRAYGKIRHQMIEQTTDYGHRSGMGYESIYGQCVRKDSGTLGANGNTPRPIGYVLIEHAVSVANAPML